MNESTKPFLKNLTLLCVDDSKTIQLLYKSLFESLFKEIIYASDGEEGLELFEVNDIDFILTDFNMPKMNGIEMIQKIRNINHNIPIILVTSYNDNEILINAIQANINNFLQKPFNPSELFKAIDTAVKILIADSYIKEKQEAELNLLKESKDYSTYQEELSFQKELKLLRNDFYYRLSGEELKDHIFLVDFMYLPLDTLSGDTYSARKISDDINFFLLVDGMGKGISASMSAMLSTAFVNYTIDNMIKESCLFDLKRCIEETIAYMQNILLEDEILSISFVSIDSEKNTMNYASFSMPAILIMSNDKRIRRLKSNNAPINAYYNPINITEIKLRSIKKILIYSDGIVENSVALKNETYEYYIEEDFKNSITREDLKQLIKSRIVKQEDDMSFIFINRIKLHQHHIASEIIPATLTSVESSQEWYELLIRKHCDDESITSNASIAYNELLMNAYEHGSLNITSIQKNKLIEDDNYFDELQKRETKISLKIRIDVELIKNANNEPYIITIISDNGDGFDTNILKETFGIENSFNGRGILMSRNSTRGIYYNRKANSVIFFIKL